MLHMVVKPVTVNYPAQSSLGDGLPDFVPARFFTSGVLPSTWLYPGLQGWRETKVGIIGTYEACMPNLPVS